MADHRLGAGLVAVKLVVAVFLAHYRHLGQLSGRGLERGIQTKGLTQRKIDPFLDKRLVTHIRDGHLVGSANIHVRNTVISLVIRDPAKL